MYKSYSYNDMPKPINTFKPNVAEPKKELSQKNNQSSVQQKKSQKTLSLGRLQSDDLILLIIIIALLLNDCDDKLLLLALAYIFFSDYFD